ncbi:MAG: hypothetical protein K2P77_05090, partial [Burkholderiaceae bacterium]|nr:hypothetical protein [Burkholderiaceae bacterium]
GVRRWTRSAYSHCELVFSDGWAASSSFIDDGVRFKQIQFDPEHWDFIELPAALEHTARAWFEEHEGDRYDLWGNVRFIVSPVHDSRQAWFCSEAVAVALGIPDAWRFDPGALYSVLKYAHHKPATAGLVFSERTING